MSDRVHNIDYPGSFHDKIVELGGYNIIEAKIGSVTALALMEQARQARIKNLVDYLSSLDWASHPELRKEVRVEIERELHIGQPAPPT